MKPSNAIKAIKIWYEKLKPYSSGFPARGTVSGALVVLEHLKTEFILDIDFHTAKGGSQIKGASGEAIKRILSSHGELRRFVAEGGRTNRGLRGDIKSMLDAIKLLQLENIPVNERNEILMEMQGYLVLKVQEFHNRQRIKIVYRDACSTWQMISDLLASAKEAGKEGPVAQYLVGAKLQMRFPDIEIGNESFSTADVQLGRVGDFLINNTAFHVTVAPFQAVYEKCLWNLDQGIHPFLLVPDRVVLGTRQNAEQTTHGQITVESIETFVSQNLEEMAVFSRNGLKLGFRQLIDIYNKRVDQTELDKSMLIELPDNL